MEYIEVDSTAMAGLNLYAAAEYVDTLKGASSEYGQAYMLWLAGQGDKPTDTLPKGRGKAIRQRLHDFAPVLPRPEEDEAEVPPASPAGGNSRLAEAGGNTGGFTRRKAVTRIGPTDWASRLQSARAAESHTVKARVFDFGLVSVAVWPTHISIGVMGLVTLTIGK